jgi:hypothetical protein
MSNPKVQAKNTKMQKNIIKPKMPEKANLKNQP